MTILVTGAGGFIGSAITHELIRRGHEVIALTRNSAGYFGSAQVVQQDLQESDAAVSVLTTIRCDAVIHTAARMANVPRSAGEVGYVMNEDITRNLLRGLSAYPPKFFLCISSIDVYSHPSGLMDENAPIAPLSDYASSKLATEKICREWVNDKGSVLGIARLTQIFGPGDRTAKLIPTVVSAIKTDRPVKLFGDGKDRRDYLFVADAARLLADWTERRLATTLNLATGQSHSMNDVLELLRKISGKQFSIESLPRQKIQRDYCFDIARLVQAFGPIKFTSFRMAMRATYDHLV